MLMRCGFALLVAVYPGDLQGIWDLFVPESEAALVRDAWLFLGDGPLFI